MHFDRLLVHFTICLLSFERCVLLTLAITNHDIYQDSTDNCLRELKQKVECGLRVSLYNKYFLLHHYRLVINLKNLIGICKRDNQYVNDRWQSKSKNVVCNGFVIDTPMVEVLFDGRVNSLH